MTERKNGMEDIFIDGADEILLDRSSKLMDRIYILAGQFYCAAGISSWCFNRFGELKTNSFPTYQEFLTFFKLGGCLDYAIEHRSVLRGPMLLTDPLDLVWMGEWIRDSHSEPYLFLAFGPVFSTCSSVDTVAASLRRLSVSLTLQRALLEKLEMVPVLNESTVVQYAKMLHYTLTGQSVSSGGIHYQASVSAIGSPADAQNHLESFNFSELWIAENAMLQFVREGSTHSAKALERASAFFPGLYAKQDGRDYLIIFTALCARAAIDGGVSPAVAAQTEVHFINLIKKCTKTTEFTALRSEILEDFVTRVRACRDHPETSPAIWECCEYVHTHLRESLQLEDIAKAMGYTEYYLTKKFRKETGIRLTDYIKAAKIEQAKILLMSSKTIEAIAEELHFSSRSYFTKVFKEIVGISPAEYRGINGKVELQK